MIQLRDLLKLMVEHNASDLYLTVGRPPSFRIDGRVHPTDSGKLSAEDTERIAHSTLMDHQIAEFKRENEINLAIYDEDIGRFRINIYVQKGTVGLVIRKINTKIPTIDFLNLPKILKDISMYPRGLVLVVGATGSGKSTTIASMIDHRNSSTTGHILTVEDPVEFVHEHKKSVVSQREVGMDTHSYQQALKNALRQAPDVVLVGEIRDMQTMEAALQFSETGMLCLATLHADNANQAVERVMSLFPTERIAHVQMQMSLNLRAIVAQRLVRRVDGGRIATIEIMLGSARVQDLISKGGLAELKEAIEKSSTVGMQSFDQHLFEIYTKGIISLEEALKNSDSQTNLKLKIKLAEDTNFKKDSKVADKAKAGSDLKLA